MTGRAYRLAGAIVAASGADHFLVGNPKQPCDFAAHGFEPPIEIDALRRPFVGLARAGRVSLPGAFLEIGLEGEVLARTLADRLLIARNGSVSERLWRLVCAGGDPDADAPAAGAVDARWLGTMPNGIWRIVRDSVLRCA